MYATIKWIENAMRVDAHSEQSVERNKNGNIMGNSGYICHIWCTVVVTCSDVVAARKLKNIMQIFFLVQKCVRMHSLQMVFPHPFRQRLTCVCVCDAMQIHGLEIGSMRVIVGGITSQTTYSTIRAFPDCQIEINSL